MTKPSAIFEKPPGDQRDLPMRNYRPRRAPTARRLMSGVLPAAAMTFGLFTFMYSAIGDYDAPPEAEPLPELARITPEITKIDAPKGPRPPVKPVPPTAPPPMPPAYSPNKVDLFIPTDGQIGGPPERLERGDLMPIGMIRVEPEREIQPISGPSAVYPPRMAERGLEGSCEVRFDVSARGEPLNIRPECTHPGFERSAKRAVAASRFSPEVEAGRPVERRNVVYPIEYSLAE